jgi:hypothetical protein
MESKMPSDDQHKPISEEEMETWEESIRTGHPDEFGEGPKPVARLIAEVRRLKAEAFALVHRRDQQCHLYEMELEKLRNALGMYGMPACWDGYQTWSPPTPELRNEPGWVLARKALGWSEPSEPCENPSCDGVKDDKNYGDAHRHFKDGRWLDDGSEM